MHVIGNIIDSKDVLVATNKGVLNKNEYNRFIKSK